MKICGFQHGYNVREEIVDANGNGNIQQNIIVVKLVG